MCKAKRGAAAAVFMAMFLGAPSAPGATLAAPKPPTEAVSCKPIRTAAQLQAIGDNATGSFCLANDIDLASIANFQPLALTNGHFFGNGHTIRNITIIAPASSYVGLFAVLNNATIQDLNLVNVKITVSFSGTYAGGLVGRVIDSSGLTAISRVHVDGIVKCTDDCVAGGIVGVFESGNATLIDSSSAASVIGPGAGVTYLGGAVGYMVTGTTVRRSTATGRVTCTGDTCVAGGLVGYSSGVVDRSGAAGAVTVGSDGAAGGLIGVAQTAAAITRRSHASGSVSASGAGGTVGGLVGYLDTGKVFESYSVGRVSGGAMQGGLIGSDAGGNVITDSYWDTVTSGQMTSIGGTGRTTTQLRGALPAGFGPAWANTKGRSYPFLDDSDIAFASPLATLVQFNEVFTFLPIAQLERSQYKNNPAHESAASLGVVYAMIARAVGTTRNVNGLRAARIDTYWNDAAQAATWKGLVTTHATLGALTPLGANAKLTNANVIGKLKAQQLVILRGKYTKDGGGVATHWMLATLYTATPSGAFNAVVANDPWTGKQVLIDPATRKVLTPDFPLKNFKVDGYRPVALLNPI